MIWRFTRRSVALGVAPGVLPVSLWLVFGLILGPSVLGVLNRDVLAHLDAVVSVALGVLGVFAGLALVPRARGNGALLAAACVESGVTAALVAVAMAILLTQWQAPLSSSIVLVACTIGAAAATSGAGAAEGAWTSDEQATRVADLDDVLPIVVAAAAIGTSRMSSGDAVLAGLAVPILIGLGCGVVGWLLFERTDGAAERAVFVLGVLALIGGASAYAAVSPLLAGFAAGMFWRRAPGRSDTVIAQDLRKFHHPLVVLLVVVAGAEISVSPLSIFLFAAFMVFRLSGKVIGGITAARLAPAVAGQVLSAYLVTPGVIGIAIALNVRQTVPGDGAAVVSAVAGGALVFELIAAAVTPKETAA
jgi:hypothetical protein